MKLASILVLSGALAGFAFLAPGSAQANDEVILASCKNDLQLSDSGCACVLDKVHSSLNEKQLVFFVAAISRDAQAQSKVQGQLTGDEMTELANFMTTTPQECRNQ